jgi:hypothetical protein
MMVEKVDVSQLPKNVVPIYIPNPGPQTEFHSRTEDFVLFGGAKSPGKTHALLFEATRQVDKPNYKAIILRRIFPSLQEIIDRAAEFFPKMRAKWEAEPRRWRFPSGATIAFGHCEHENDKFDYQGKEYSFMGFDQLEEFTESQVRYLTAQVRTSDPTIHCYIRATANPGNIGHWWIKRRFIDGKKPNVRYEADFGVFDGKRLYRSSAYVPATIYDNPVLLKANPQYLAELRALPEQERKAFLEGDWNAFASDCIFDVGGMSFQQSHIIEPATQGYLRDAGDRVEWIDDDKVRLSIFKHPEHGHHYMIVADVAKGVEGGDNSAALVIDRLTREVMAQWHGKIEPMEYANVLFGIGVYYNFALLCVEVWPGPGIATGSKLVEMGYPKLYERDLGTRKEHGWITNEGSRQEMIATLQYYVRTKRIVLRDQTTIDEMYSFIRNERGRFEARSSKHDDLVICASMAAWILENEPLRDYGQDSRPMASVSLVRLPTTKKTAQRNQAFRSFKNGGLI